MNFINQNEIPHIETYFLCNNQNDNQPVIERTVNEPQLQNYQVTNRLNDITNRLDSIHKTNQMLKKHRIMVAANTDFANMTNIQNNTDQTAATAKLMMLIFNMQRVHLNHKLALNSNTATGRALYTTSAAFHGVGVITSTTPHVTTSVCASLGGCMITHQGDYVEKAAINANPQILQSEHELRLAKLEEIARAKAAAAQRAIEDAKRDKAIAETRAEQFHDLRTQTDRQNYYVENQNHIT